MTFKNKFMNIQQVQGTQNVFFDIHIVFGQVLFVFGVFDFVLQDRRLKRVSLWTIIFLSGNVFFIYYVFYNQHLENW